MAHHDIQVFKKDTGGFGVTPKSQHARTQHTVRWTCNDGALQIVFAGSSSPLKSGAMIIDAPSGTTGIEKIKKPTEKKGYSYVALVTPAAGGGTFTADPDLIIDDGGGGGGKKKKSAAKTKSAKKKAAKK